MDELVSTLDSVSTEEFLSSQKPSDVIRAAAQRLREVAASATPGPWMYQVINSYGEPTELGGEDVDDPPMLRVVGGTALPQANGHAARGFDANHLLAEHDSMDCAVGEQLDELVMTLRWMALVSPDVAEMLALMMEHQATELDQGLAEYPLAYSLTSGVLAFSKKILKECHAQLP